MSRDFHPFHLATVPIEKGVTLIEASAGTGKTFSIAGLVLRLVLEEGVPIQEILAVTFTVAATQELRDRVRRRLRDALEDLRRGGASSDDIVRRFLSGTATVEGDDAAAGKCISRREGVRRLDAALQCFDEAQIFTIHGFCQRLLKERAFESGMRFDAELLTDATPLLEEVAHDFWRLRFYQADPLIAALAIGWNQSPGGLLAMLGRMRNHPDLAILPAPATRSCEAIAAELAEHFTAIRELWRADREAIAALLGDAKAISQDKAKGFPPERLEEILEKIDEACGDLAVASPECIRALTEICTSNLEELTKANQSTPAHALFDRCEAFCRTVDRLFEQLTHEFLDYAAAELPGRKLRANVLTYDDLLMRVHRVLESERGGAALAASVGRQYRAALIDEFQDTDPVQYGIFRRLFGGSGAAHWLYFIGDPKQAIYGFRGADMFTYFRAVESAGRCYTLDTNHRSEARLLDAVNRLFRACERPFVFKEIAYRQVRAPEKPRDSFATLVEKRGSAEAPLQFRLVESARDDGKDFNQAEATEAIACAVAADIARWHASGAKLGGRPLRFCDLAVLVRKHSQARAVQAALRARGLRSVLHTEESVFATSEADELQRLIEAVLEPRQEHLLRTALVSPFIGLDAPALVALEEDETLRQEWHERFLGWRARWENECFMAMFRKLLIDQGVRERLVRLPGGERRLTDLLHLAELLHAAETEGNLTPDGVCGWLRDRRREGRESKAAEEHQLRLESDGDAVLIATIHRCKGLEYPVVFCPFLWAPAVPARFDVAQFHDPRNDNRLTFDLRGSSAPPEHLEQHRTEALAEEMRLLYVAVTRAKNRGVIYGGAIQKFEESPLAHLLGSVPAADLPVRLEELCAESGGNIGVSRVDPAADTGADSGSAATCADAASNRAGDGDHDASAPLSARSFMGTIPRTRFFASFTGLTSSGRHRKTSDREDDDKASADEETTAADGNPAGLMADGAAAPGIVSSEPVAGVFGFDRGPRAGDFFHDVLEELDFQAPAALDKLVPEKLELHGFRGNPHREALHAKLRELLDTELAPGVRLRDVSRRERLSELAFWHRLPRLDPARLRAAFAPAGTDGNPAAGLDSQVARNIGRLEFNPVEGCMRGFIDLLFRAGGRYYVVDWKSNWLGNRPQDYDAEGLRACMLHHHYFLQARLYTLAADLFLAQRLPGYDYERDFGGVIYVFLRGIEAANPARGIHRHRPGAAVVGALRSLASPAGR